jgi:hypothetical protein
MKNPFTSSSENAPNVRKFGLEVCPLRQPRVLESDTIYNFTLTLTLLLKVTLIRQHVIVSPPSCKKHHPKTALFYCSWKQF